MSKSDFDGSYIQKAISMAKQYPSPMGRKLKYSVDNQSAQVYTYSCLKDAKTSISNCDITRRQTYLTMNHVSEVYKTNIDVPEYACIAFSRIRLSSHSLKIETGRLSRIPREDSVSVAKLKQSVLLQCPLNEDLRLVFGNSIGALSITKLLNDLDNWGFADYKGI